MLNRWTISILSVVVVGLCLPGFGMGQTGNPRQSGAQQSNQVQLTPQQQEALRRAAQQSTAKNPQPLENYVQDKWDIPAQRQPVEPPGFPIPPGHAQYLNSLLDKWQQTSQDVEKFKCGFVRHSYDNAIVNWRDPQTNKLAAHTISHGEIRFAAPDRARYETTVIKQWQKGQPTAQNPRGLADYQEVTEDAFRERWICDGKHVYEFDFGNKVLKEIEVPPHMQGNVAESPFPFLFGVNKQEILERYWVRPLPRPGVENEYWIELTPKRKSDAQTYKKIEVILAREDFLPKAMHMYMAQYDGKENFSQQHFEFYNRSVNKQLNRFQDFFGGFIRPRILEIGWKRVQIKPGQNQSATAPRTLQNPAGARLQ